MLAKRRTRVPIRTSQPRGAMVISTVFGMSLAPFDRPSSTKASNETGENRHRKKSFSSNEPIVGRGTGERARSYSLARLGEPRGGTAG